MKTIKQGILLCAAALAFWGVLYPQFSLVEESYEVMQREKNPRDDFFAILEADEGDIIISSRLLELWKERREVAIKNRME